MPTSHDPNLHFGEPDDAPVDDPPHEGDALTGHEEEIDLPPSDGTDEILESDTGWDDAALVPDTGEVFSPDEAYLDEASDLAEHGAALGADPNPWMPTRKMMTVGVTLLLMLGLLAVAAASEAVGVDLDHVVTAALVGLVSWVAGYWVSNDG